MIVPDSLWWNGRWHTGAGLQDGSVVAPAPDGRRLPGTVLPGLVDAHVHSALVDLGTVRAGGISAVWDLGANPAAVQSLSVRKGLPRLAYAGPFLTAPGGYPSDRSWAPSGSCHVVHSPSDAAGAVAYAQSFGATLIKVTAHAGGPQLSAATLAAVVTAAHASSLPVVVHAEGPGTVAAAYESGADLLAHTPWTEPLDAGLIRACAERMTWISTLDIHGYANPTQAQTVAIGNLHQFHTAGGSIRYGTDLGNGPLIPGINPREIRALQQAGLTPTDILTAMTEPNHPELTWIPGGLTLNPATFADVLATARVLDHRPHEQS